MAASKAAPGDLELVRAFVNTAEPHDGRDDFSSGRALVAWLSDRGLASPNVRASGQDRERAVELREAIRASLLAHNEGQATPPDACAAIDRAAQRARLLPRLRPDGSSTLVPEAAGVDGALGRLLAIVHESVADGTWPRLKACRDPSCQWAFYDHTKNHSGTWCSMAVCGNRSKARAYRERAGRYLGRAGRYGPAHGPGTAS